MTDLQDLIRRAIDMKEGSRAFLLMSEDGVTWDAAIGNKALSPELGFGEAFAFNKWYAEFSCTAPDPASAVQGLLEAMEAEANK